MSTASEPSTREPAMAGRFYPREPDGLRAVVERFLDEADPPADLGRIEAIIAPHAGYVYSGPIAATVYAALRPFAHEIERVVLLGPAHRVFLEGLALPQATRWATPLGTIEIDAELSERLERMPQVFRSDHAHAAEHSLEVQLPFLQAVLGDFTLVPLVVGDVAPSLVAEVLDVAWGGPETLVVMSSDLSHYLSHAEANRIDEITAQMIMTGSERKLVPEQACGARGINGLLRAVAERGLEPHLLDLRNSGDTAGDRDRVVGYGAFAFTRRART